jgi:hypothetical protein
MKTPKQVKDRRGSLRLPKQVKEVKRDVKNAAANASVTPAGGVPVMPAAPLIWPY